MKNYLYSLFIALALCSNLYAQENNVVYPLGTNVVNVVTNLGVDNTGDISKATSNTEILQRAILEYKGVSNPRPNSGRTMYFPNGVYYINAPIESGENCTFCLPGGQTDAANIHYQGQSESGTIIRIVDGSAAFADAANPKYAISYYQGDEGNNDAFNNTMEDMTINIGSNNSGAGGVEFTSNNVGTIRNVTIKSEDGQGVIGIKMSANLNGLSLLKNVEIEGFQRGIFTRAEHCVIVMEELTLNNQGEYGIYNDSKPIIINKLVSNNNVPAIYSFGGAAHVTLTNGTFNASQTVTGAAIQIKDGAGAFLRNLQSSNFESIATINNETVEGSKITEYVAHLIDEQPMKLWNDVPNTSMDLKLEEEMITSLNWTEDVSKIHIIPRGDTDNDSPMIQAQLDAAVAQGKTHVMFAANGTYTLRDRIKIPAGIQRITGDWAYFSMGNPVRFENGESLFYFEKSDHDVVLMEKMLSVFAYLANREEGHTNGGYFIENVMDNSTTLYLRDMFINYPYYRGSGNGKVYVENVNIGGSNVNGATGNPTGNGDLHNLQRAGFDVTGQTFLAKHVDSEFFRPNFKFTNATAKIQGYKVGEKHGTHFEIRNSKVEILGGVINTVRNANTSALQANIPILEIADSEVSFVGHERGIANGKMHNTVVRENQNGVFRILQEWVVPNRTSTVGKFFTLYSTALDPSNSLPTNKPDNSVPITDIEIMDTQLSITIDGELNETAWETRYEITKSVVDNSDNEAFFSATWDATNLYVGVEVIDKNLHNDGTSAPHLDDGVEIYFDADNSKANSYDGSNDYQFFLPYNSTIATAGPNSISDVTGINYITKQTDKGYNLEVSIPWATLRLERAIDGIKVGFDIAINDDDDGADTREGQIVWAGTESNWQNASAWGTLTLQSNTITSTKDDLVQLNSDTLLYPNPTSGIVKIDYDKPVNIKVFDSSGKSVLSLKKVKQFDMSKFPIGVYQVQIGGEKFVLKKISKQ